jgi:DNA polymerase-3 subunit beta
VFKVDQQALKDAVGKVTSVISRSSISNVLECVLLEIKGKDLVLTGSNGEVQVTTMCEIVGGSEKDGAFAVNSHKLRSILATAGNGDASFKRSGGELNIDIKNGGKYKLTLRDGGDYPRLVSATGEELKAGFDQGSLFRTLKSILPTITAESHRMYLKGAYFDFVDEGLRIVGTDGHRLACNVLDMGEQTKAAFIVPHKALDFLKSHLASDSENPIELSANKEGDNYRTVSFRFEGLTLICQLISGQYPDYTRVIPTRDNNANHAVFDRAVLADALKQVCAVHDKPGELVELTFTPDKKQLILKARGNHSQDEGEVKVALEPSDGFADIECQFNAKFLDDLLGAFEGYARIFVAFKDGQTSVLVEPQTEDETHLQYVVMPVRS